MSWLKIKKIIILKCRLLLFYIRTTNHFLIGLWHMTKSGFFMTTGDNQLSGWTKKKLQSTSQRQTCTKKGQVTIWWSAACLIHYSFLNASESITSEKCARKLMRYTKTPQCLQPALVNREGPVLFHDNAQLHKASKVEWVGLQHSASSAIFTWPLANQLPLLQAFW